MNLKDKEDFYLDSQEALKDNSSPIMKNQLKSKNKSKITKKKYHKAIQPQNNSSTTSAKFKRKKICTVRKQPSPTQNINNHLNRLN